MKKTYAFLLSLLVVALSGFAGTANAQYTMADYNVKANGDPYVALSGATDIPEITPTNTYDYSKISNEITLPFNFRYVNIITNKIKVTQHGSVIVGGTDQVPDGVQQYNAFYGACYANSFFGTFGQFLNGQQNLGNYGVIYPNNTIHPWVGYQTALVGQSKFDYQVQGTAPFRKVIIESIKRQNINQNTTADWQVVIYEGSSFISKVQINYGPQSVPGTQWYNYGYSIGMGIKSTGGSGGYLSVARDPQPTVGNSPTFSTTVCYDNEYKGVPTVNYIYSILYDYNLAFSNAQPTPADGAIVLKDNPFTPTVKISNEGRYAFSAVSIRCLIQRVGDALPAFDQTVALSGTQIPAPFANQQKGVNPQGTGTVVSFPGPPQFTPVTYGVYNMTFSIASSVQSDQYAPDNSITTQFIVSPPNNVASIVSLLPAPNSRAAVGYATPVTFQYRNLGVNNQTNVPVSVYITNPQGTVLYRDTLTLNNWLSSQFRDTTFKDFTPTQNGDYKICGVTQLVNDQNSLDDTACNTFQVRFLSDVQAVTVLDPDDLGEKPELKPFKPVAQFQNVGVQDLFDVPARVQIRRCADNALVFQADSIIPELNTDQGLTKFSFPSKQGNFDIAKLAPGCYKLCAIARQGDDGDRTNDTTCQFFSIIPRLQGDINVGVGQRFPTISASVDSMRYRGVGPNDLNLILTDANYTENGNTSVSGVNSAIEFRDISGPGPTTRVTYKPKFNVSPTITFTGNKAICFLYSYKSANYITWNGLNEQAPAPDAIVAEPTRRNIKIINSSTAIGAVFAMEYGRNNLAFKNLNIIGNGNLTNVGSHGIRITNLYNTTSFLSGITDTSDNHHITVDNCFVGNANTGIYDIGTVPLFDIGKAFYLDRRNNNNRMTRNTIGSVASPIGAIGILTGNEDGLVIDRNEISWVTGNSATNGYSAAIAAIGGNSVNLLVNGNKIHNIKGPAALVDTIAGIDIRQASVIYVTGTGPNAKFSTLPVNTGNRVVNNMLYDVRTGLNPTVVSPISIATLGSNAYTVDKDSIFNNSIAVDNAPYMVQTVRVAHPFIWNNIFQNLNKTASATAVMYKMTVPRPMFDNISSNYNLFDFRNASLFANLTEYDMASGTQTKTRLVKDINEWRTLSQQDIYSVGGDPRFTPDSLHLPIATTYIPTAASNSGIFLNTATQNMDIDGDLRLVGGSAPDMGADEFEGFQYTNDLAVMVITKPSGLADATGTTFVTAENPLAIQAIVKNLGSLTAANRTVTSQVDVSTNAGATWSSLGTTSKTLTFAVNEAKTIDFVGPNITAETGKLYRVTVFVGNDQNNGNNSLTKIFKILVKRQATLLSYNSSTAKGLQNRDSLSRALDRLGVPYDLLDRNAYLTQPVDYSPWWTIVWATGDPNTAYSGAGNVAGVGAVSQKESEEIISFLKAGQTYAKKSFVIAGQNVAQYMDTTSIYRQLNNVITDNDFMTNYMHTRFVAQYPGKNFPTALPTSYKGKLVGTGVYFVFPDTIVSTSPDVIKPTPITGVVGTNTSRFAYFYGVHPSTPVDSGAGTAWNGAKFNVVFYPFDWADALETVGTRDGEIAPVNVSGTTRFTRGALDFLKSFGGTVLPVEFTDVNAKAENDGNLINWSVTAQKDVDHFEVETLEANNWNWVGDVKSANSVNYSFLHTAINALEVGKSFSYRVVAVDLDGSRNTSKTVNVERTATGLSFTIEQNRPNPFTASTVIGYTLPANGTVAIRVLDLTGKVISVGLDNESMTAGTHEFKFNANNLATGTYIYEISFTNANGETSVLRSKMTLTK